MQGGDASSLTFIPYVFFRVFSRARCEYGRSLCRLEGWRFPSGPIHLHGGDFPGAVAEQSEGSGGDGDKVFCGRESTFRVLYPQRENSPDTDNAAENKRNAAKARRIANVIEKIEGSFHRMWNSLHLAFWGLAVRVSRGLTAQLHSEGSDRFI